MTELGDVEAGQTVTVPVLIEEEASATKAASDCTVTTPCGVRYAVNLGDTLEWRLEPIAVAFEAALCEDTTPQYGDLTSFALTQGLYATTPVFSVVSDCIEKVEELNPDEGESEGAVEGEVTPAREGEGTMEGEVTPEGEGAVEGEVAPEGEGEGAVEGEVAPEGEGEGAVEGEVTPEGEGEGAVEGEVTPEGEVEGAVEGEVTSEGEGEGAVEGEVAPEGEGEGAVEGEVIPEGEGEGEGVVEGEVAKVVFERVVPLDMAHEWVMAVRGRRY